ncbi:MRG-domain-containing protein [Melampsora americana]|nr:MRG-domain-containing protein [Melampsora americana]
MVRLAFAENERVLCYHGPLIYEAKVLKAEDWKADVPSQTKKGVHYWVHYKGWKQSWDEWVPEDRLLKLNEENLRKQKELNEARRLKDLPEKSNVKDKGSTGSGGLDKGKKPEGRGTKRSREIGIETEEEPSKRPNIRIVIPEPLKLQLVDDWEAVTRKNQVVTLPRNPTVGMIFQEYETYATQSKPSPKSKNLLREVLAGVKVYFDKSLGHSLLYRYERQQYIDIRKRPELENKLMSDIYGAEHLLRLFVNLPEMISHTPMEPDVVVIVREHISDMLEWMVQEQKRLFQSPYDISSPAYQNINRAM